MILCIVIFLWFFGCFWLKAVETIYDMAYIIDIINNKLIIQNVIQCPYVDLALNIIWTEITVFGRTLIATCLLLHDSQYDYMTSSKDCKRKNYKRGRTTKRATTEQQQKLVCRIYWDVHNNFLL